MMRFITGQYSKAVQHGGMLGYVLDSNIKRAMRNVEANVRKSHKALLMRPPGALLKSSVLELKARARETDHQRSHESHMFRIHHLFMANPAGRPKMR
jgi:hypothetical protein